MRILVTGARATRAELSVSREASRSSPPISRSTPRACVGVDRRRRCRHHRPRRGPRRDHRRCGPTSIVHGAAFTAVDACESEPDTRLRVNVARHPPRRRGGPPRRRARRLRVDRLRVRRHQGRALRRVGPPEPAVGLRPLQARRRARARPGVDDRAHVVGVRRPRQQHGQDDPAPRRPSTTTLSLRRRPARPPDLRRRPRRAASSGSSSSAAPASSTSPTRARSAGSSSSGRPRGAGHDPDRVEPDHDRRPRPAPPRAPARQLGARQRRAAPVRASRCSRTTASRSTASSPACWLELLSAPAAPRIVGPLPVIVVGYGQVRVRSGGRMDPGSGGR